MEYVDPSGWSFGHNIDPMQIGLEAYRLMAMFLSADPIEKISLEEGRLGMGLVDSETHWLEALRSKFFWDEVSRILIYLAIPVRPKESRFDCPSDEDPVRQVPTLRWSKSLGA